MKYDKELVEKYTKMIINWDNPKIIFDTISKYIEPNKKVLELGSGTGKDYELLKKTYQVTPSDYSEEFLKLNKDFILIDSRDFKLKEKVDLIYSNKVLHHLNLIELKQSLNVQYNNLNDNGYVIATLWHGDGIEVNNNMKSYYYNEEHIKEITGSFQIIDIIYYDEMNLYKDKKDSMIIILKKPLN